jgi:hypothetical protein
MQSIRRVLLPSATPAASCDKLERVTPRIVSSLILVAAAFAQVPTVRNPGQLGDRTGKFKVGDMAPDFELKVMHKETRVALSSFRNRRPVALVFGSYT